MTLRINESGNSTYHVILDDALASHFCKTTAGSLTGTLTANSLTITGTLVCTNGSRPEQPLKVTFLYHPDTDTITDGSSGAHEWTRKAP